MQNFDIKQMKFILIVTSICLVFACAVMQAYKYLPEEDATSNKLEPSIGIEQTTQYSEDEVLDEESEETNEDEIVDEINTSHLKPKLEEGKLSIAAQSTVLLK